MTCEIPQFSFALREDLSDEFLPTRGSERSTGYDVRCANPQGLRLKSGDVAKIHLGFRVMAPEGWWLELRPRSSTFAKKHLHCLYGVIDEDFEGNVQLACQYIPPSPSLIPGHEAPLDIEFGERIAQLVPVKRVEAGIHQVTAEEFAVLSKTRSANRGGGFGSTGDK